MTKMEAGLQRQKHEVEFCVVGGGLAGMCAAIAAARRGVKVALMHDRPVPGGNCSSEVRMWVGGASGFANRETGILEELALENMYRNPMRNYSIWDSILYEKVRQEENIIMLLNCSCSEAIMDGSRIRSIKGWQLTTYTWHEVVANYFADCSGDSILAPLTGAKFRLGREAAEEFNEDIAPAEADAKTMGLSCLIQARETDSPKPFVPPDWAYVYETEEDLPHRGHDLSKSGTNFWWIELGGDKDSIHDTEALRDDLLKVAFGVWDHIKNKGDHGAENWELDWVGFLPGKRESRRYVGDHILTQHDVQSQGRFDDIVAYGGWSMDDHHPSGMNYPGKPTIHHPAPSPYGIAYRCLYSKNIENLFFAGRNISATHAALSSTRVMATCAVLGQAVGTAVAVALQHGLSPRQVYHDKIGEVQQALMDDDCYLPLQARSVPQPSASATLTASHGDPQPLRNGLERPLDGQDNGWSGPFGAWVEYAFATPQRLKEMRLIFDSDLERLTCSEDSDWTTRKFTMSANYPLKRLPFGLPKTMVKEYAIQVQSEDGQWREIFSEVNNYQRLVRVPLNVTTKAIRFIPKSGWGSSEAHLFACDVY